MKKFIVGGVVVVLLGGYALWSASRSQTPVVPATDQTSAGSETTNPNATGNMMGTTSTGMMGGGMMSTYKDGTYTGVVGSAAPYGDVQVKVTIAGGKLTKVDLLTKPSGPGYTDQLSDTAFPILVQEAITAQSAKVHIVSGATQDSQGFQQSLTSALVKAQG